MTSLLTSYPDAPPLPRALALTAVGDIAYRQNNLQEALTRQRQAATLFAAVGYQEGVAATWVGIGSIRASQELPARAWKWHERALALRRRVHDARGIASSLENLGNLTYDRGDFYGAQQLFEESLAVAQELPDLVRCGSVYNDLGYLSMARGDLRQAIAYFRTGLALKREIGDQWAIPYDLVGLANVALLGNEYQRAARLKGAADTLCESMNVLLPEISAKRLYNGIEPEASRNLGTSAYQAYYQEGRRLTLSDALDLALGDS